MKHNKNTKLSSTLKGLFRDNETNKFERKIIRLRMPAGRKRGTWLFYKCGQGFELGTNKNKSSKQSQQDMKFLLS